MWNFKGYLWNSTQNILPIHWKIWFLYSIGILRALRFKSSYAFLKRPPVPSDCACDAVLGLGWPDDPIIYPMWRPCNCNIMMSYDFPFWFESESPDIYESVFRLLLLTWIFGYFEKKISQYIHLPGCSFWGLHIIFFIDTDMTSLSNVLMEWGTCTWSEGPFPFSKYVFSLGKRNDSVGVILFVMVFLFMLRLGDSWRIHRQCQVY